MEMKNLEKAMDIYARLVTGEDVTRSGANSSLYEDYYGNAEVYEILRVMLKKLNLNIYEYKESLFLSPGDGNRVFGYTNEEMKRAMGLRVNRELYLAYFIIYEILLAFYSDSASYQFKEYIRLENGEFVTATADTALYQRLNNNESYEDGKTVVKSWVGSVDSSFPSLHLSTEKPEAVATKVTIGTQLKSMINNNRTTITAFERSDSTPPSNATDATDYANSDENVVFKIWKDGTTVYWWSDADIIYLPSDCSFLFCSLNSKDIEIDLSAFDFSKVTKMTGMFASYDNIGDINNKGNNTTKITKITFPSNIDTLEVTDMSGLFYGCANLKTLDLTGFNTANVSSMQAMFKNCSKLEEIKLDPTKFTDDSLTSVFRMFDNCNALKQIDFRGFKGGKLENAQSWFAQCKKLEYIDLSNFNDGSKITNLNYTFQNLGSENTNGCAIFSNKWKQLTLIILIQHQELNSIYMASHIVLVMLLVTLI